MSWLRKNLLLLALIATVAALLLVAVLPFFLSLGNENVEKRLAQWSNYGQSFGIAGAILGWLAFLCSLYTIQMQRQQIDDANRQTLAAGNQTNAVIAALKEQVDMSQQNAKMNGIAALLHYLITHQHIDPEDSKESMKEKAFKCKRKLEEILKPY